MTGARFSRAIDVTRQRGVLRDGVAVYPANFERKAMELLIALDDSGMVRGLELNQRPAPRTRNRMALTLPFTGEWLVLWGGDTPKSDVDSTGDATFERHRGVTATNATGIVPGASTAFGRPVASIFAARSRDANSPTRPSPCRRRQPMHHDGLDRPPPWNDGRSHRR